MKSKPNQKLNVNMDNNIYVNYIRYLEYSSKGYWCLFTKFYHPVLQEMGFYPTLNI